MPCPRDPCPRDSCPRAQGGVGMMIALDPESRRLVVLGAIEGSPADHAGIMEGDVIESINGLSTRGWSMERTAKFLRGKAGTTVNVKVRWLAVRVAAKTLSASLCPGRSCQGLAEDLSSGLT